MKAEEKSGAEEKGKGFVDACKAFAELLDFIPKAKMRNAFGSAQYVECALRALACDMRDARLLALRGDYAALACFVIDVADKLFPRGEQEAKAVEECTRNADEEPAARVEGQSGG